MLAVVCLVGCDSSPDTIKFDATNLTTAGNSMSKMTEGMTEDQRQVFMARASAVSVLLKPGGPDAAKGETLWRGIQGMTKREIEAKADELLPKQTAPAK
jgi:hypothetical protein